MKQVNSEMVADVITEIGVGSRFPHKSKKSKGTFYESVANELNYLMSCPSDSIARLFGDYLANNGIDVEKFNRTIEGKYHIGLFQDDILRADERPQEEQQSLEETVEAAEVVENPDVREEESDRGLRKTKKAVADFLSQLGLYSRDEVEEMYELFEENKAAGELSDDEVEPDEEKSEPNLRKASTPFAAIKQFTASILEWFTNQHYEAVDLEEAREIAEIEGILQEADYRAEKQKPCITIEIESKKDARSFRSKKGEATKKLNVIREIKTDFTREYVEGLEDFVDIVTLQAEELCESRRVEDCKTSLGLELESIRSQYPLDLERIQQLREKVEQEKHTQAEGLRDAIDSMQTLQIEAALSRFRFSPNRLKKGESPELSDKEIEEILYGIRVKGKDTRNQSKEKNEEQPEKEPKDRFGGMIGRVLLDENGQDTLELTRGTISFAMEIPRILTQRYSLNVMSTIELNEDGSLFIGNSRLTVEDLLADNYLEGQVLYDKLRLLAVMPRAIDLNDTEVLQLAHCMSFEEGRILVDFSKLNDGKIPGDRSWYDKGRVTRIPDGFAEGKAVDSIHELYMPGSKKLQYMQNMEGRFFYDSVQAQAFEEFRSGKMEELGVYDRVLLELEALENLAECQLFAEQVTELGDRYDIITDDRKKDGGFTKKEKKSLDALRRAAGDKVKALQRKGFNIYDIVWRDKETEVKLLQKGREYFVQEGEIFRDSLRTARQTGQEDLDQLRYLQDDEPEGEKE